MYRVTRPTRLALALIAIAIMCLAAESGAWAVGRLTWSRPVAVDDRAPFGAQRHLSAVSCPSSNWCAAVETGGRLLVSKNAGAPRPSWRATRVPRSAVTNGFGEGAVLGELQAISCPSRTLCVTVDSAGDVVSSRDPWGARPRWVLRRIDSGRWLTGISCPAQSLCVAVDQRGHVITSHALGGPSRAWSARLVDKGTMISSGVGFGPLLDAVSCPSVRLCVALDQAGNVVSSRNPGARRPTWRFTRLGFSGAFAPLGRGGISCPSISLCVFASGVAIAASSNPTGGSNAWHGLRPALPPSILPFFSAVTCVAPSVCAVADTAGDVLTTTEPSGATPIWTRDPIDSRAGINGFSCPGARACVAVDGDGRVLTTTDLTGGAPAWKAHDLRQGYNSIDSLTCPAPALCVAADSVGRLLVSRNPVARRSAWRVFSLGSARITSIDCPSLTFCYGMDSGGHIITSMRPAAGPSAWSVTTLPGGVQPSAVSCSGPELCVVAVLDGNVLSSNNPSGGTASWTLAHADTAVGYQCGKYYPGYGCDPGLASMSCPTRSFCAGSDFNGNVITSSDPAAGAWKLTAIGGDFPTSGHLTCPSPRLCVRYTSAALSVSDDPARSGAWTAVDLGSAELTGITCGSPTLCVAFGPTGTVFASSRPSRASAWRGTNVDAAGGISLKCSRAGVCIGFDNLGNVLSSATPAAKHPAWRRSHLDPVPVTTAQCPSQRMCVATDGEGNVLVGTVQRR